MLYSTPCEQAIRALVYLAQQDRERITPVKEIAREAGIPVPICAKVLHTLARHHIVRSTKGPGGGFILGRGPEAIVLRHVVDAIDGLGVLERCPAGLANCSDAEPCPLHDLWKDLRSAILGFHENTSILDMARVHAHATARASRARLKSGA